MTGWSWSDVQTENGVDLRILEHTVLDHQRGATTAARQAFLRRLEDELHRSRNLALHARKYFRSTHEHRDA